MVKRIVDRPKSPNTQLKSLDYVQCSSATANIPWSSTEFSRGHLKQKILAMFIVFMNHLLFLLVCLFSLKDILTRK